jgi:hypothetical protein
MTLDEKRKLASDLISTCETSLQAHIHKLSVGPDGLEIRKWIAVYFTAQVEALAIPPTVLDQSESPNYAAAKRDSQSETH